MNEARKYVIIAELGYDLFFSFRVSVVCSLIFVGGTNAKEVEYFWNSFRSKLTLNFSHRITHFEFLSPQLRSDCFID